jgi:pimeloyl-ACP methyl ester carboxylesterase
VIAGHSLGGMFALSYAHRYPEQIAGIVLLDSMRPRQDNAFAGTSRLLAVVPTLARIGLARLAFDRQDGKPTTQALQLTRDITAMPPRSAAPPNSAPVATDRSPSSAPVPAASPAGPIIRTTSPA